MRPRCEVESILTSKIGSDGSWIPMKVTLGSWVTLQAGKRGGHAKDARKHNEEGGYKAKVIKFRVKPGSSVVFEVLVQHAYTRRQVQLNQEVHQGGCNYLYLSLYQDWIDPKSILDIMYVVHADIGEAQRGLQTHRDLLKLGVYFYSALYFPSMTEVGFGRLEMLPLPDFNDPEWLVSDMVTSESFRSHLRSNFLTSMNPNIGSKSTHIHWFMPVHIMVDLFATTTMHRTPTLFVFKKLIEECFTSLMDEGWDIKICVGMDVIKCIIDRSTVVFRYHLGRSILYSNFTYNCQRRQKGFAWENLEEVQHDELVTINCDVPQREEPLQLEVGLLWTLFSVRQEINISLGYDNDEEFTMCITENGQIQKKINVQSEKHRTVTEVLPPRILRLLL